jgi:hypothetical protein
VTLAVDLDAFNAARDFAALRESIKIWVVGNLAGEMEPSPPERQAVICPLLPSGFVRIATRSSLFHSCGQYGPLLRGIIGIALVCTVVRGPPAGSMLPLLLSRLGLDQARSSAPFVATLVHVCGLLLWLKAAGKVLRGTPLVTGPPMRTYYSDHPSCGPRTMANG